METDTYIALLRGINVGGHRPLKMAKLQEMFGETGYKNVTTYIQSGNVVFDASAQNENDLAGKIKAQIKKVFDYEIPVIVRSATDLSTILEQMPFAKKKGWKRYITFLSGQPNSQQQQMLEAQSSEIEIFRLTDRAVYIHVDKQTDKKPLFSSNFIQKQLGIPATNRNLRTIRKILDIANF